MEVTAVAQPDGGYGQGFGIRFGKKKSVPTELDEFRENSDEFRTQFGEISECKV
jgi:hypothetical protein